MTRKRNRADGRRGAALLAVLWLTAALATIAFSVASTVRAETERASSESLSLRASYLAAGAIQRAVLWYQWGQAGFTNPNGAPMYFQAPTAFLHFEFPDGAADVEMIPETSKLDVNQGSQDDFFKLLLALRVPADRAMAIAAGILAWRTPAPGGGLDFASTFQPRHASIEEIDELLLIPGMTPDIFYGGFQETPDGQLIPYGGLRDCVSVYGSTSQLDVNTVTPGILGMLGMIPPAIDALIARRKAAPFQAIGDASIFAEGAPGFGRLSVGGQTMWTLRATARIRLPNGQLSELKKTEAAVVKFLPAQFDPPYHYMRWYSDAPQFLVNPPPPQAAPPPGATEEAPAEP